MKIKELHLNKWMVIRQADFEDLSDFVVIAGPNGVGKTKIKDAIVYIFQNSGNPPPGSKVILEATNAEERSAWEATNWRFLNPHSGAFSQKIIRD
jgi:predicted ATP-binding protein involved in virulence